MRARNASLESRWPESRSHGVCRGGTGAPQKTVQTIEPGWLASSMPQLKTASSKCGETTKNGAA
jgi:hypothetical protein